MPVISDLTRPAQPACPCLPVCVCVCVCVCVFFWLLLLLLLINNSNKLVLFGCLCIRMNWECIKV